MTNNTDEITVISPSDLHPGTPAVGTKAYTIKVDKEEVAFEFPVITGLQILEIVGKSAEKWHVQEKIKGGQRNRIEPDQKVDLTKPGIERFETVQKSVKNG